MEQKIRKCGRLAATPNPKQALSRQLDFTVNKRIPCLFRFKGSLFAFLF